MNEKTWSRGPNLRLLLLIPAAMIAGKALMRRRAMWASGWGPTEAGGRGFRRRARFAAGERSGADATAFRLPPKIEWILDTWHTRAHLSPASATAPDEATSSEDAITA